VLEILLLRREKVALLKKARKGLGMERVGMTNHPIHIKNDCFGHQKDCLKENCG
jgi:hypothetical protein